MRFIIGLETTSIAGANQCMTVLVANISVSELMTEHVTITCPANFTSCLFGTRSVSTTVQFIIGLVTAIFTGAHQCVTIFVANIIGSKSVPQCLAILHAANFANCRFGARSFPAAVQLIFGFEIAVVTSAN